MITKMAQPGNVQSETSQSRIKAYFKEMGIQVLSGGSAGFLEVCIMHPLDIIKTRMQVQRGSTVNANDPHSYKGVFDCFAKMYRHEGILSCYKGILPPILAETPRRAIKFMTFEQYKRIFSFGQPTPSTLTYSLAGMLAGVTEGLFVNPFEVVKVTLQSNKELAAKSPSTWAVTSQIVKNDGFGFSGLNKGIAATLWRNALFNSIYFGFYFTVKDIVPALEDPVQEFLRKSVIGFASGTLGAVANIPFDVAKSRIQGPQPIAGQIKYKGLFNTLSLIHREEGFFALYKGLTPKVMRLGPGGAIMLLAYEYAHGFYSRQLN